MFALDEKEMRVDGSKSEEDCQCYIPQSDRLEVYNIVRFVVGSIV